MRLRHEVIQLLHDGREDELIGLLSGEPRALRHLLARLYDKDAAVRQSAARAIGRGAAVHRELGLEIVRRLLWALNDESATNGVYGIPALGEIGKRAPELLAPFVSHLVAAAQDDGLRVAVIQALAAVAESAPERVRPHLGTLERLSVGSRPEEREALRALHALLDSDGGGPIS
jgi:hypothetical protein